MRHKSQSKVIGNETLGIYPCVIWKKSAGANTTYSWVDDDGMVRLRMHVSTRPVKVRHTAKGNAYVVSRKRRITFDELVGINRHTIEKYTWTHATHDTAFSGWYLDAGSFSRMNGDYMYVAYVTS